MHGVIDCNELKTEKRHECTNMGKVKDSNFDGNCTARHCLSGTYETLGGWIFVQRSVQQAAVPGTEPQLTAGTAGTTNCNTRDSVSPHCYSWYNRLQYQGLSLTSLLQLVWGVIFQHPSVTHTADVRHANWCSNFTGNFWAICPLVRAAEGRLLISKQWWSRNGSVWLVANIEPSFFCDGILKLVWRQDRLINVLAYFTGK